MCAKCVCFRILLPSLSIRQVRVKGLVPAQLFCDVTSFVKIRKHGDGDLRGNSSKYVTLKSRFLKEFVLKKHTAHSIPGRMFNVDKGVVFVGLFRRGKPCFEQPACYRR